MREFTVKDWIMLTIGGWFLARGIWQMDVTLDLCVTLLIWPPNYEAPTASQVYGVNVFQHALMALVYLVIALCFLKGRTPRSTEVLGKKVSS